MKKISTAARKLPMLFWLLVVLPTLISLVYFGFIASDKYVSVSSFVVRSPQKSTSASGLSALLQNVGFSRSQDDAYVVHEFAVSRGAMEALDSELGLRAKFHNPAVDMLSKFNPFGMNGGSENLYEYYKDMIKIDLDSSSSISTLSVTAFSADDAHTINEKLLGMSENLVNQLNQRGRQDLIATSEDEVKRAENRVNEASTKMTEFRAKNQIFDVEKQSALQLQLISKLQDQLILVKTQITQVKAVTPDNPQIKTLKERERSITQDISNATKVMLGGVGGSLNQKSTEYERLALEKDVATKQLVSVLASFEQNKAEASRKQLYLERISQPNKPDSAIEPRRIRGIVTTFLLGLIVWGISSMLIAGIREHND